MSERTMSTVATRAASTITNARYPSLFQINTRVWLTDLARRLRRPATLDDIPDEELDRLADRGFDWIWFLSVWRTGPAGRRVSRSNPEWREEFQHTLPDLQEDDIAGSGFAIAGYTVDPMLGGDAALARLRTRLLVRGRRLMLDFVPNHMALDHPWSRVIPQVREKVPGFCFMAEVYWDREWTAAVITFLSPGLRSNEWSSLPTFRERSRVDWPVRRPAFMGISRVRSRIGLNRRSGIRLLRPSRMPRRSSSALAGRRPEPITRLQGVVDSHSRKSGNFLLP